MERSELESAGAYLLCRLALHEQCRLATASLSGNAPPEDVARGIRLRAGGAAFLDACGGRLEPDLFKAMAGAMDQYARKRLEDELEKADAAAYTALKAGSFDYDALEHAALEDLKRVLEVCDRHDVFLALKGSSPMLRARVFSALEPESAMQLRVKVDTAEPVPLNEVEAAQRRIALRAAEILGH